MKRAILHNSKHKKDIAFAELNRFSYTVVMYLLRDLSISSFLPLLFLINFRNDFNLV